MSYRLEILTNGNCNICNLEHPRYNGNITLDSDYNDQLKLVEPVEPKDENKRMSTFTKKFTSYILTELTDVLHRVFYPTLLPGETVEEFKIRKKNNKFTENAPFIFNAKRLDPNYRPDFQAECRLLGILGTDFAKQHESDQINKFIRYSKLFKKLDKFAPLKYYEFMNSLVESLNSRFYELKDEFPDFTFQAERVLIRLDDHLLHFRLKAWNLPNESK